MEKLLKRIKTNALLSAALYTALGVVLLVWPALSTRVLCLALGAVMALCGLADILVFLTTRKEGTLYAALHLVTGVILAAVGAWLMTEPTLLAVVVPRIMGVLICVHGLSDLGDALSLRKNHSDRWAAALLLALITLLLGGILVYNPFRVFATVVRVIGAFLVYDGISGLWITLQVSRAVKMAAKAAEETKSANDAARTAVDTEFRDVTDE